MHPYGYIPNQHKLAITRQVHTTTAVPMAGCLTMEAMGEEVIIMAAEDGVVTRAEEAVAEEMEGEAVVEVVVIELF